MTVEVTKALLAFLAALVGAMGPADGTRPSTATQVYYSFDVEASGLPRRAYVPRPRDVDVTYRDLDTGQLVTERGVDADWSVTFEDPATAHVEIEAVAHGGGNMWCAIEVYYADDSGWALSDHGRRRCRLEREL